MPSNIVTFPVMFHRSGFTKPDHKEVIETILDSDKDSDLVKLKKRLLTEEGIEEVRKKCGLMRSEMSLGYAQQSMNGIQEYCSILSNSQLRIALMRMMDVTGASTKGKYILVGRVKEVTTVYVASLTEATAIVKKVGRSLYILPSSI